MEYGTIYIIKNTINDNVYIGQTTLPVNERFKAHIKRSTILTKHYKLYNAMRKYGRDKFYYEILEENIPINELDRKEIFYIEKYDSFNNGYNSTKGGDGRTINKDCDEEIIIKEYSCGKSSSEIAEMFGVSYNTILRVLERRKQKIRKDGRKYDRFEKNHFIKLWYDKHITTDYMAHFYKVDNRTIARHARRLGLKRKPMVIPGERIESEESHEQLSLFDDESLK